MALFDKYNSVTNSVSITPTEGRAIYQLFKQGYDETPIFTKFHYDIAQSVIVKNEIKSLEAEIISRVSGEHLDFIEQEFLDEEGTHIETIATPYVPTTKEDLICSLVSEILDTTIVVNDCIAYNPDFNANRTWEDFKLYYFGS